MILLTILLIIYRNFLDELMNFILIPKAATAIRQAELDHMREQRRLREQEAQSPDEREDLAITDLAITDENDHHKRDEDGNMLDEDGLRVGSVEWARKILANSYKSNNEQGLASTN